MVLLRPCSSPCELLDGVFLATSNAVLQASQLRFDPRFMFHFYGLDFCRSARPARLKLGTWPIWLTHQSSGNYFNDTWAEQSARYLDKWKQ